MSYPPAAGLETWSKMIQGQGSLMALFKVRGMQRQTWAERYASQSCVGGLEPCAFLVEHLNWLARGRALDIAMGEGRNAAYLVENGFSVLGVEREPLAIERARLRSPNLKTLQVDLEKGWRPPSEAFVLVLVVNYLQRDLFPTLQAALKPGGALLYETSSSPQMRAEFRLQPNELLRAFGGLHCLAYREWGGRASLLAVRPPASVGDAVL